MASSKFSSDCSNSFVSSEEECVVRVLDSNEPLGASVFCEVQILDSNEPFVYCGTPPDEPSFGFSEIGDPLGIAVPSRATGYSGRRYYTVEELRSLWSWRRLYRDLGTEEQCIAFAEERGMISKMKMCSYHKKPMFLESGAGAGHLGKFVCRGQNCKKKIVSRAAGTWFENAKLPMTIIFQIMFAYCEKTPYHRIRREVIEGDGPDLSSATISNWYNYCRETIVVYEIEHHEEMNKIGGPGKVVHIDEFKFGKRQYNRGKQIEGHWVIGMIEDKSDDLRFEVCPDNLQIAEVLVPLIQKHVEVGSIIYTDCWSAYTSLTEHGYVHKRVNNGDPENRFVAPDVGYTQHIEWQRWGLINVFHKKKVRHDFADWLIEYSWCKKVMATHKDPFDELIEVIKYVYPVKYSSC